MAGVGVGDSRVATAARIRWLPTQTGGGSLHCQRTCLQRRDCNMHAIVRAAGRPNTLGFIQTSPLTLPGVSRCKPYMAVVILWLTVTMRRFLRKPQHARHPFANATEQTQFDGTKLAALNKPRENAMRTGFDSEKARYSQQVLPRLTNSLGSCIRWRVGDLEAMLDAQIRFLRHPAYDFESHGKVTMRPGMCSRSPHA